MTAAKKKASARKDESDVRADDEHELEPAEQTSIADPELAQDAAGTAANPAQEKPGEPAAGSAVEKPAKLGSPTGVVEPSRSAAQILADSSVEFRDPLQSIHGALELLVSGKVPDERQVSKILGIAYRETIRLSHRVSDLNVASQIETGKLRLKLSALSLPQLLEGVIRKSAPLAADKPVSLKFAPPDKLPTVHADEELLRMLVTNLVEAGIKCTPREGVLAVEATAGEGVVHVRMECQPREGQPEDEQAVGGHDAITTSGLALYVADRIAAAHDGTLRSVGPGPVPKAMELTLPIQPKGAKRGRILVVDDNPQAALLLEYALRGEGFEAIKAMNGLEGLTLAKMEKVDLIILDVLLPGLDGFEVCHRLRSDPETANTPVIMVSAKARDEDRATAMRIGADAYFGKPLGMAELMVAIEQLLGEES